VRGPCLEFQKVIDDFGLSFVRAQMIPSVECGLFLSPRPLFVSFKNSTGSLRLSQAVQGRLEGVHTQLGVEGLLIQWDNLASNITGFIKLLTSVRFVNESVFLICRLVRQMSWFSFKIV